MNTLPAVLIGGPPHAGKSVLFYSLTQALRKCGIVHHAIRACPDGEGNWSQETDQAMVRLIRINKSSEWPEEFTERICRDIEQRLLPMLIDMGGKPQGTQLRIFQHCTHSLLLLKPEKVESAELWQRLVDENGLLPIARLYSSLDGPAEPPTIGPVIEGTLTGLERGTIVQGQLFNALVDRLATLFGSFSEQEKEKALFDRAPTEIVVHLTDELQRLFPGTTLWEPQMIPALLASLPQNTGLSIYGQGPQWLYSALVAFVGNAPFYQFDPRMEDRNSGWITPPRLHINSSPSSVTRVKVQEYAEATVLDVDIHTKHLDYLQAETLSFPPVSPAYGLILSGQMPSWLVTALVRLYIATAVPWIACYQPQLGHAVVVTTRTDAMKIGEVIPLPTS